jgi:hypothetical protein
VLQNDFGPRSEEHFFQIKPEKGILIQNPALRILILPVLAIGRGTDDFCNTIGQLQTSESVDKGATPPRYFLDPARFRAYKV